VIGVEQLTVDGAVIRTIAKTTAEAQPSFSGSCAAR
jgi:small conductance mechanosensitive channel